MFSHLSVEAVKRELSEPSCVLVLFFAVYICCGFCSVFTAKPLFMSICINSRYAIILLCLFILISQSKHMLLVLTRTCGSAVAQW